MSVFVSGRLDVLGQRVGRGRRLAFEGVQSRDHLVFDRLQVHYHQVRLKVKKKKTENEIVVNESSLYSNVAARV